MRYLYEMYKRPCRQSPPPQARDIITSARPSHTPPSKTNWQGVGPFATPHHIQALLFKGARLTHPYSDVSTPLTHHHCLAVYKLTTTRIASYSSAF